MDEYLTELYGTADNISSLGGGEDLEKSAAADFLVKLAQQEGIDLDSMSDEEVGEVLAEIEKQAAAGDIEVGSEEEAGEEEGSDESTEKLAEADFLGRAMAHAYVDEMAAIEKQAGAKEMASKGYQAVKGALGRAAAAAKSTTSEAGGKVSGKIKGIASGRKAAYGRAKGHAKDVMNSAYTPKARLNQARQVARELKPELIAGGGLAAAGGAAAAMRKKGSSEVFEDAARERAYALLAEAGYDVEKVAEADVETRALQMLEQSGYEVQWNE